MKRVLLLGLAFLALAAATPQTPRPSTNTCNPKLQDPDLAIRYCSEEIDSGRLAGEQLAAAYALRAAAYRAKERYDESIADHEAIVRLSKTPQTIYARGMAYVAARRHEQAIADLESVIRERPRLAPILLQVARWFTERQEFGDGLPYLDAAVRLSPKASEVLVARGNTLDHMGAFERAIADYNAAIALDRNAPGPYHDRGIAYRGAGDYRQALQDFDTVIRLGGDDPILRYDRGHALYYLGRYVEAAEDFGVAAKARSDYGHAQIWHYLAQARAGRDGRDDLRAKAEKFSKERWPGPVMFMLAGRMSPSELIAAAQDPVPRFDRNKRCEAFFFLGQHYLLQGRRDEAKAAFEATLATGVSEFVEYRYAKTELARLELSK